MRSHRRIGMTVIEQPEFPVLTLNRRLDGSSIEEPRLPVVIMIVQQLLRGFITGRQIRWVFHRQQVLPLRLGQLCPELYLAFYRAGEAEDQVLRRRLFSYANEWVRRHGRHGNEMIPAFV